MTVREPTTIPAIAPFLVIVWLYSDNIMSGPNAAPNPAHAYATNIKTLEFLSVEIAHAMIAIAMTVNLPTHTSSLSVASFLSST